MKIVRLVTFLDFGGVEKMVDISAKEMIQRNEVELIVIAIGKGGRTADSLKEMGINTLVLNQSHRIPNFKTISVLYKLFNKIKPDIVHTSGAEANFHGLIAAYFSRIKIRIGEEIGFPNHRWIWKNIFKRVYASSTRIICISKAVKKKIIDYKEVKEEQTALIYNPAQVSSCKTDYNVRNNSFMFICVCRLFPVKNLDNLIKAFTTVVKQVNGDVRLQIVGDGPEKEKLLALCELNHVSSNVEFVGFKNDVEEYLKQADAFILPSYSEGFSLALVEGMLVGLPCIATKVGGPSEIITNGKTGFLIDPYNIQEIEEMMMKVLKLSDFDREQMGREAKKSAQMRFGVEVYVNNLLALYGEKN